MLASVYAFDLSPQIDYTYASYVVDPLDVDVDGDTRPDSLFNAPPASILGSWPRCIEGASVMSSSWGGEMLCIECVAENFKLTSEVDGFCGRFWRRVEEESSDSTAKERNPAVLLLTLRVHLYSDNLVR